MTTSASAAWRPPSWRVLVLAGILVIMLNVFDALSTLEIVRRGGEEANPIARKLFEYGDATFFFWKTGLASACAIALALGSRRKRFAWHGLWFAIAIYAAVAALHVYLLWFLRHPS